MQMSVPHTAFRLPFHPPFRLPFHPPFHPPCQLLYVCFHVLLNLAEEPDIERKMTKRDIVGLLVGMLSRQNAELLVLVLLFLKKISVFKENLPAIKVTPPPQHHVFGSGHHVLNACPALDP